MKNEAGYWPHLEGRFREQIREYRQNTISRVILLLLIGGAALGFSARIQAADPHPGAVDTSFDVGRGVPREPARVHVQPDGRVLVGDVYLSQMDLSFVELQRLNLDGSVDSTFAPGTKGLAGVDREGRLYTKRGGELLRLHPDGSVDPTFRPWPYGLEERLPLIEELPDGRLVAGVVTRTPFGAAEVHLQALTPTGEVDSSFFFNFGGDRYFTPYLRCLVARADGSLAVVSGSYGLRVVRPDKSVYTPFGPDMVWAVAEQADGKLLVVHAGEQGSELDRLLANGHVDPTFHANLTNYMGLLRCVTLQQDGKILVGGAVELSASARSGLVRLNGDGSVDETFDAGKGARAPSSIVPEADYGTVTTIALAPDNKIIVGGAFNSFAGEPRTNLVRLYAGEVAGPPRIQMEPADQTVGPGTILKLQALVSGSPSPMLQWRQDGLDVPGATNNVLVQTNLDPSLAGAYVLIASNSFGMVTTRTALVSVALPPTITVEPVNVVAKEGYPASFSITVASTLPATLQWRRNGVELAGATNTTLTFYSAKAADAGTYDVVVRNGNGQVTSRAVTLDVTDPLPLASGAVDPEFVIRGTIDGTVYAVAGDSAGGVYIGGMFSHVAGSTRAQLARLGSDGSLDPLFAPDLPTTPTGHEEHVVDYVFPRPNGRVLVVGRLVPLTPPSPSRFPSGRYYVAQYLADGTLDPEAKPFVSGEQPGLTPTVYSAALRQDGGLVTSVRFTSSLSVTAVQETRSFDLNLEANSDFHVQAPVVLPLPNDLFAIGSFYGPVQLVDASGAIKVDLSGVLEPTGALPRAVQADGKILVTSNGGRGMVRLNSDGTIDKTFSATAAQQALFPDSTIQSLVSGHAPVTLQPDGRILVATAGSGGGYLTRLNSDGSRDDRFGQVIAARAVAGSLASVQAVALDAKGRLLVAGIFDAVNGVPRLNLARLHLQPPVVLRVEWHAQQQPSDGFSVLVDTVDGQGYQLESAADLTEPNWTVVKTFTGTGQQVQVEHKNPEGAHRFYRVRLSP